MCLSMVMGLRERVFQQRMHASLAPSRHARKKPCIRYLLVCFKYEMFVHIFKKLYDALIRKCYARRFQTALTLTERDAYVFTLPASHM